MQTPGGDAAIVRVEDGPKGLALTTDVTPRYCEADPVEGGKQAVAEAWRNITAVGGRPLAITDNLNFGNPERPEVMGQLVGCIRGIGEACRALDFPVVSGNVSLYNETNGRGILPTPTIGGVGVLDDVARPRHARASSARATRSSSSATTGGWLGQSLYLARDLRPRGGRAAAGRPRGREAQRRLRAPAHPVGPGRHGARLLGRRPRASRWPRWRWRAASARCSPSAPATSRSTPSCSARTRAATCIAVDADHAADILYERRARTASPAVDARHDGRRIR